MVPLVRYTTVTGIPLTELLPRERIDALVQHTRQGGNEIVKHLRNGSAYYAPSAAAAEMAEAILKDTHKILCCTAYLEGEYGINGYCLGVPCKLGSVGLEEIIKLHLNEEELAALGKSAATVKELCDMIGV
jgi:malate dehydrogenase